jgi:hypothetical protein
MTHDEAKKLMAAEAYILNDLETAERNAFEEHFFDCTDCAADVLDAAKIADGIRTGTNVVPFRHYSRWAAAAAAAAVAVGLAYNYVPQVATNSGHSSTAIRQRASVNTEEQAIELGTTRGGALRYHIDATRPVSIYFGIEVVNPIPPYRCELRDETGSVVWSKDVRDMDEVKEAVRMDVPAGKFHTGEYSLKIRGGDGEIASKPFAVDVQ